MVNILSVDVDWIMEPSIESYNGRTEKTMELTWKNILTSSPSVHYPLDARKYNQLVELLFSPKNRVKKENIYLGESHEEIARAIEQWKIEDTFNVYNIDHHHDCGYENPSEEKLQAFLENVTCANWVVYLNNKYDNFGNYTWICNFNSYDQVSNTIIPYLPNITKSTDIDLLDNVKFDYIFICKSMVWIPVEHQPLIESLYYSLKRYYQI